jgi:hypothetical protein
LLLIADISTCASPCFLIVPFTKELSLFCGAFTF